MTDTQVALPTRRTLHSALVGRTEEFSQALAGRIDPAAFVRVAYTTITKSPRLGEATQDSVMMALLECAALGLMPNGVMGEAYLVPFNNKVKYQDERGNQRERWEVQAQFIPGYRGLIKLARQSGVVRDIVPGVVRDGDTFEVVRGLHQDLVHRPDLSVDDSDAKTITHVYAIARFADGGEPMFDVMGRAAVERIRARSKTKDDGPWKTDWEAMAIKTVIRRIVKFLPASDVNLARAIEADNRDYVDMADIAGGGPGGRLRIADRLAPLALGAPPLAEEIPERFADLDAAGLSGDVAPVERLQADAAPAPVKPARTAVAALAALVADTRPTGKAPLADERTLVSLRQIAMAIGSADGEEAEVAADGLLALANDPKLAASQAVRLQSAALLAAEDLGVRVGGAVDELPLEGA